MTARGGTIAMALLAMLLGAWAFGAADSGEISSWALCRHPGADGGEVRRVDLGRVGQGQGILSGAFRRRLRALESSSGGRPKEQPEPLSASSLPGCARPERRRIVLPEPLPPGLRARRLVFLGAALRGAWTSQGPGALASEDVVFALGPASLEVLAQFGRRLGREVTAASPAFAQQLQLRCVPSRVDVSSDGETLIIEEGRP